MPRRNRPFAAAALMCLSACAQHTAVPSRQLAPGDPDYPVVNPSPIQVVKFTAIVPPTLSSDFHLHYFVDLRQEGGPADLKSPLGCHWTQRSPFAVDLPLKLKRIGNTYTGQFSPDHFLPGACGWHLEGITNPDYNAEYSQGSPGYRPILFFTEHSFTLDKNSHPPPEVDSPAYIAPHIRIWCTRRGKPAPQMQEERGKLFCTSFEAVRYMVPDLPPELVKSVPFEEYSWNIYLSRYARSLTIEFHDLDSLLDAISRRRRSATGVAQSGSAELRVARTVVRPMAKPMLGTREP